MIVSIPRCGCQGKPADIVARTVAPEIVEQQERIGLGRVLKPEGAVQVDARALDMGLGAAGFEDGADRHWPLLDLLQKMGQPGSAKAQMHKSCVRGCTKHQCAEDARIQPIDFSEDP